MTDKEKKRLQSLGILVQEVGNPELRNCFNPLHLKSLLSSRV
jgi:hypothetical protein